MLYEIADLIPLPKRSVTSMLPLLYGIPTPNCNNQKTISRYPHIYLLLSILSTRRKISSWPFDRPLYMLTRHILRAFVDGFSG